MAYGGTRVLKGKDGGSYTLLDLGNGEFEAYRKVPLKDLVDALGLPKNTVGAAIWQSSLRDDLFALLSGAAAPAAAAPAAKPAAAAPAPKKRGPKPKAKAKAAAKAEPKKKKRKYTRRVPLPGAAAPAAKPVPAAKAAPAPAAKPAEAPKKRKRSGRHGQITEEVTKAFAGGAGITNSGAMLEYMEKKGFNFNRSTVYTMMSTLRRKAGIAGGGTAGPAAPGGAAPTQVETQPAPAAPAPSEPAPAYAPLTPPSNNPYGS